MPVIATSSHSHSSHSSTHDHSIPPAEALISQKSEPKHHHLFLSKPFTASSLTLNNASNANSHSRPSTPTIPKTPQTPGKFRSQINHLLPKHSYFQVRIEIQQLASVPFVRGEFGVRWKFKGVHRHAGGHVGVDHTFSGAAEGKESGKGFLGKAKAKREKGKARDDESGGMDSLAGAMMKEFGIVRRTGSSLNMGSSTSHDTSSHQDSLNSNYSRTSVSVTSTSTYQNSSSLSSYPSLSTSPKSIFGSSQYLFNATPPTPSESGPSVARGVDAHQFSSNLAQSAASSSMLFSPTSTIYPLSPDGNNYGGFMSPSALSPTGTMMPGNLHIGAGSSSARGLTPYLPLKDHSITFNYPLTTVLRLDVQRGEEKKLLDNEFKVVIIQRVIPDDPGGVPQNPRLGAVYLNLSEYVDKGKVERRYLLRDSRVNATLKLSVEVTYLSGDRDYVAPPLPKSEILGGIEGFLQNDAYRKRPGTLDIYGPYKDQEELDLDLLGMSRRRSLEGGEDQDQVPQVKRRPKKKKTYDENNPYALPPSESESEFSRRPRRDKAKSRTRTEVRFENNPYALPPEESDITSTSGSETDEELDYEDADDGTSLDSPGHLTQSRPRKTPAALFDVQRLPLAYGTKTTEALIEALFNPVETMEKKEEGPFTVYVPPKVPEKSLKSPGEETIMGVGIRLGLGMHMKERDVDVTIGRAAAGASLNKRKDARNLQRSATGVSTASTEDGVSSSIYTTSTTTTSTSGSPSGSASGGSSRSASLRSGISSSASRASHANSGSRHGHSRATSAAASNGIPASVVPLPIPLSNNLSVPDGRMDKTGVVAGSGAGGGEESTFNLKGWWKGLGMRSGGNRSRSATPANSNIQIKMA